MARRVTAILGLLLALTLLSGCGLTLDVRMEGESRGIVMPEGPTPVLVVKARQAAAAKSGFAFWGIIDSANAAAGFAELLSSCARTQGRLDVQRVAVVAERLEEAHLEPTLQPTPKQLAEFASALGCETYLEAEVLEWGCKYVLMFSWAKCCFRLSCRSVGGDEPLWQVRVKAKGYHVDDRGLALRALERTFRDLRRRAGADSGGE